MTAFARTHDPLTSHLAAASAHVSRLEEVVLDEIRLAKNGLTIDELVAITGLDKVSLSPRFRPLCKKGLIIETNETRRGASGRRQTVWRPA